MQYIVDGYEFSNEDLTGAAYQAADPIIEHYEGELLEFLSNRWSNEFREAQALDVKENGYSGYEANPSLSQFADCIQTRDGQKFIDVILEFVDSIPKSL